MFNYYTSNSAIKETWIFNVSLYKQDKIVPGHIYIINLKILNKLVLKRAKFRDIIKILKPVI